MKVEEFTKKWLNQSPRENQEEFKRDAIKLQNGTPDKVPDITYPFNGKRYTAEELFQFRDCKPSLSTLIKRLENGMPVKDALYTPVDTNGYKRTHEDKYKIDGNLLTPKEIHEKYKCAVSLPILTGRLKAGWSAIIAIETPIRKYKRSRLR